LEDDLGDKERAKEVRALESQLYNKVVLPSNFAASLDLPPLDEGDRPSIFAVVSP
jgi:hypothetical protein